MNLKNYTESTKIYIEDKDRVFHTLCLVSDTANLLEKLKYFKNENSLLLTEIGGVIFRSFALMSKLGFQIGDGSNEPLNLEDLKLHTDDLNTKFPISEYDLMQSIIMELGIISNIITENMKYDIAEYAENDNKRLKGSLYSYILFMLILVCKYNFSIDRVLEFNIKQLTIKSKNIDLKHRNSAKEQPKVEQKPEPTTIIPEENTEKKTEE